MLRTQAEINRAFEAAYQVAYGKPFNRDQAAFEASGLNAWVETHPYED